MRRNNTLLFPLYFVSLFSLSQFSLVYNTLSARFAQIFFFFFELYDDLKSPMVQHRCFLPYSWSMSFIFLLTNLIYIFVYIHVIAIFVIIYQVSLLFHFSYSNPLFRVYCLNLLFNIRCLEPLFNIRLEFHVLIVNTSHMLRLYSWDPLFKFMNILNFMF